MIMMMMTVQTSVVILLVIVPFVLSQQDPCRPYYPQCNHPQSWHVGADRVRPSGTVVHGHANIPAGNAQGTVHGSHVFGGPHNGAQTVGGGLNYQHNNGLRGGVDITHNKGYGNTINAGVGGSTKLGPGTLSVNGGASKYPGSSHIQGQVGATYSVPLP